MQTRKKCRRHSRKQRGGGLFDNLTNNLKASVDTAKNSVTGSLNILESELQNKKNIYTEKANQELENMKATTRGKMNEALGDLSKIVNKPEEIMNSQQLGGKKRSHTNKRKRSHTNKRK